jgi:hypothetical protein
LRERPSAARASRFGIVFPSGTDFDGRPADARAISDVSSPIRALAAMTTFKCRAEGMIDVGELLSRIHAQRVEILGTREFPDVEVTIEDPSIQGKALDLASLRAVMRGLTDGQVMDQTLATAEEYTGERDHGEPGKA